MKKAILLLSMVAAMATTFTVTSCSSDEFGVEASQNGVLTLSFTGEKISTYKTLTLQIKEINTGT